MTLMPPIACAIRPGEHACARLGRDEDQLALALAFMRHGLDGAHRILCLGDGGFCGELVDALCAADGRAEEALAAGQVVTRSAHESYLRDGTFDADRMIALIRDENAAALRDGYAALSITGDMRWAYDGAPGADGLADYERRLDGERRDTLLILCRYDARFAHAGHHDVSDLHELDIGPELATLLASGNVAAARTMHDELRLTGELDYVAAEALERVLAAHFHGRLVVDLRDLHFVDVAGMRALRGRKGQPLRITAASASVRRMLALLGWDTDPGVEMGVTA
jgi:anti-anti-sigma factor